VVVVLVAAFVLIDHGLRQTLGIATLRDVRVPLGILLAAGAVSGHHWVVQRQDRTVGPAPVADGPVRVLLVGPRDDALAGQVSALTGARVEGWVAAGPAWDPAAVLAALVGVSGSQVLVLSGPYGLQVVPTVPPSPAARQSAEQADGGVGPSRDTGCEDVASAHAPPPS
jgi:hypothetical protein